MRSVLRPLLLVLLPIAVQAQNLKPGEWRSYTSMRTVQQIALSADSNSIWVATSGGAFKINLRDNNAVTPYRTTDGLSENDISAIGTDAVGRVYFGGRTGGFDVLNTDGKLQQHVEIRDQPGLSVKTINRIYSKDDRIYIATAFGLSIYSANSAYFISTINHVDDLPLNDSVLDVLIRDDRVYLAMSEGVAVASASSELTIPATWRIGHLSAHPTCLVDYSGRVLVGTDSGLYQFSGPDTLVRIEAFGTTGVLSAISRGDSLYLLTSTGLLLTSHDLAEVRTRDVGSELAISPTSLSVTKDRLAVIGTRKFGIILQTGHAFTSGIFPEGPVNSDVDDLVFSSRKDQLYSAHGGFGLSAFSPIGEAWVDYPAGDRIPSADFIRIIDDPIRDLVWTSAFGTGLFKLHNMGTPDITYDLFNSSNGLPSYDGGTFMVPADGMIDRDNNFCVALWAANGRAIAYTADGQTFNTYRVWNSSDKGLSWGCLTQDHEGTFWVGTIHSEPQSRGVFWSRPTTNTFGEIPAGPLQQVPNTNINAILTDQDDGIWCAHELGVSIISNPYAVTQSDPRFFIRPVKLVDQQVVHAMAVDGIGNKWIGTDNGIFVVSPDGTDSIAHFSKANSPLLDDRIQSLAIDQSRGEIYAGTPSGISRFSTIFTTGKPDYTGIRVYPNPLVQNSETSPEVTIDGLVAGSTVKVFTLNGKLVATINGSSLGATVKWDGRDSMGRVVTSGLYLITATSPQSGDNGEAKLVIVRETP